MADRVHNTHIYIYTYIYTCIYTYTHNTRNMLFPTSGKLAGAAGCDTKACHGSWSSFICTYKHTYTNTHHRLHLHPLEALDPTPDSFGLRWTHFDSLDHTQMQHSIQSRTYAVHKHTCDTSKCLLCDTSSIPRPPSTPPTFPTCHPLPLPITLHMCMHNGSSPLWLRQNQQINKTTMKLPMTPARDPELLLVDYHSSDSS